MAGNKNIENVTPIVMAYGLKTDKAADFDSTLNVQGAVTFQSTLAVAGATTFTTASAGAGALRTVTNSALVGATVVLTAAQCGQTFNNRATSGSPSWTLPTASNGLWYSFTVSDVTTGFTITGGTMKYKTTATGSTLSTTTLTNTQATAVVNDTITLVCDGTVWRMTSQSGIFA